MNTFINQKNTQITRAVLLGLSILALGTSLAFAKNGNDDSNERGNSNSGNNGNNRVNVNVNVNVNTQGSSAGQTSQGNTYNPFSSITVPTFDKTDYVDFGKDVLVTPCLLIKNFSKAIDGQYYNVKFRQRLKSSASEWYVTNADPEPECGDIQYLNPFQPVTRTANSYSSGSVEHYRTRTTTPTNPFDTFDRTASVDFKKDLIDIPCLLIKGFSREIDGTYYHIQMEPQDVLFRNISDWKVKYVKEAPECTRATTELFK